MNLTNKETYQFLIVYQRYALTRWNHLQPSCFFDEAIDLLKRWQNDPESVDENGFNWIEHTAKQLLEEFNYNIGWNGMMKGEAYSPSEIWNVQQDAIKYVESLGQFLKAKKLTEEQSQAIQKINELFEKEIGLSQSQSKKHSKK